MADEKKWWTVFTIFRNNDRTLHSTHEVEGAAEEAANVERRRWTELLRKDVRVVVEETCPHGQGSTCQICKADMEKVVPISQGKKPDALELELQAMRDVAAAVAKLEPEARFRVLHWAGHKFAEMPHGPRGDFMGTGRH
jgi:hypothetical protein